MIREFLANRTVQASVVFIVVVVVGSLLYLQHVEREHARSVAETAAVARRYEEVLRRAPQRNRVGGHPNPEASETEQAPTHPIPRDPNTRFPLQHSGHIHPHPHPHPHASADKATGMDMTTVAPTHPIPRNETDEEWIVMWPPDIPGLGVHPERPRPPAFPEDIRIKLRDLERAVRRGELLSGDKASVDSGFVRRMSDAEYQQWLEGIRQEGTLTQEEADQRSAEILSEYWNVDLDDTDGLLQRMEEYEYVPEFLLKRLEPELAFQTIFDWWATDTVRTLDHLDMDAYAERALAVNPNNLDAHYKLAETLEDFEAILERDPNYYYAIDIIAGRRSHDAPEEVIPMLQKSLALGSRWAPLELGYAYERLGDYKTAWVHYYKSLQMHPDGQVSIRHMEAILRGEPRIEPIQRRAQTPFPSENYGVPQSPTPENVAFEDVPTGGEVEVPWSADTGSEVDSDAVAARAAAAEQAERELSKLNAQAQQELEEFLHWLEHGQNDTPQAQDFLSQEMKTFLNRAEAKATSSNFEPARLIRAQEVLHRYGREEGLKRLERTDPEIASQIRRNPPLDRDFDE